MVVMESFELASRNVLNKSYEVRRKPRPLFESLRFLAHVNTYLLSFCMEPIDECLFFGLVIALFSS